jgi:hypothetical protein
VRNRNERGLARTKRHVRLGLSTALRTFRTELPLKMHVVGATTSATRWRAASSFGYTARATRSFRPDPFKMHRNAEKEPNAMSINGPIGVLRKNSKMAHAVRIFQLREAMSLKISIHSCERYL